MNELIIDTHINSSAIVGEREDNMLAKPMVIELFLKFSCYLTFDDVIIQQHLNFVQSRENADISVSILREREVDFRPLILHFGQSGFDGIFFGRRHGNLVKALTVLGIVQSVPRNRKYAFTIFIL